MSNGSDLADVLNVGQRTFVINGKTVVPRGLGIGELLQVEADCLRQYQRDTMQGFATSLQAAADSGVLSDADVRAEILAETRRLSTMRACDLPVKTVYEFITADAEAALLLIRAAMESTFTADPDSFRNKPLADLRKIIAGLMEQGLLTPEECAKHGTVLRERSDFVAHWVNGTKAGQIAVLSASVGVSAEDVCAQLRIDPTQVMLAVVEVGRLSAPPAKKPAQETTTQDQAS